MAQHYKNIDSKELLTFDKVFSRANGQPLDNTIIYYSLDEAKTYAATQKAYVGQIITVIDETENTVKNYSIIDTEGNLEEVGKRSPGQFITNIEENDTETGIEINQIEVIENSEIFNDYENNKIYSNYNTAAGKNNQVGMKAFKILEIDETSKSLLIRYPGKYVNNLETNKIKVSMYYSYKDKNNSTINASIYDFATITSISIIEDGEKAVLYLSDFPNSIINAKLLWFNDYPYLGDIDRGEGSYAQGIDNIVRATASSAKGRNNTIILPASDRGASHVEGYQNYILGSANSSHVEGQYNRTYSNTSHIEGQNNVNIATTGHMEGFSYNWADDDVFHKIYIPGTEIPYDFKSAIFPENDVILDVYMNGTTLNDGSTLKSRDFSLAKGSYVHVEGYNNVAIANATHAEGQSNIVTATGGHVEGLNNNALAMYTHVEGRHNSALAQDSHISGGFNKTNATAIRASIFGYDVVVDGPDCFAAGYGLRIPADTNTQIAFGKYNKRDSTALFIVGNGTSDGSRSNAFVIKNNEDGLGYAELQTQGDTNESIVIKNTLNTNNIKPSATFTINDKISVNNTSLTTILESFANGIKIAYENVTDTDREVIEELVNEAIGSSSVSDQIESGINNYNTTIVQPKFESIDNTLNKLDDTIGEKLDIALNDENSQIKFEEAAKTALEEEFFSALRAYGNPTRTIINNPTNNSYTLETLNSNVEYCLENPIAYALVLGEFIPPSDEYGVIPPIYYIDFFTGTSEGEYRLDLPEHSYFAIADPIIEPNTAYSLSIKGKLFNGETYYEVAWSATPLSKLK